MVLCSTAHDLKLNASDPFANTPWLLWGHQHLIGHLCTDSSLPPPSISHHPYQLPFPSHLPQNHHPPNFFTFLPAPFLFGSGTRESQPWLHNRIFWGIFFFFFFNSSQCPYPTHTNYIRDSGAGAHAHIISQSSFYVAKVENHLQSSSSKPCPGASSPFIFRKAIKEFS